MAYRIIYESSFTYTLDRTRVPSSEKRATMESARKRVIAMAEKMGLKEYRETSLCGDPYLNFGPTFGAHIERA